jgi:hypothetical protein
VDFLTKKSKKNNGEIAQYYVEDSHEAIISKEVFELVQIEIERRRGSHDRQSRTNIYSSRIKCGCCGNWYGSKVWHSNDKYKRTIYQCNHKFKDDTKCTTPHLTEEQIQTIFISAANKLITDKHTIISDFRLIEDTLVDTAALEKSLTELKSEKEVIEQLSQKYIAENARKPLNQDEYNKRFDSLTDRETLVIKQINETENEIADKKSRKKIFRKFISDLEQQNSILTEFDSALWNSLVDYITVKTDGSIEVTFKNGVSIEA